MNVKDLVRDPARAQTAIKELPDGRLIAVKECKIYIPLRFSERSLAEIGVVNYIVGIFAIVTEGRYLGISLVNAMLQIEPSVTLKIKIDGVDYYEFTFMPGSTICSNVMLVKNDVLVYKIYNEIISKGRVPWYLGYEDLGNIFGTAKYHANANLGDNPEVTELIISLIARDKTDRTKYYRSTVHDRQEVLKNPPAYIPLKSVIYAASNTTNKLAGSYFSDGVVSALVSPSERSEKIESILLQ